MDRYHGAMHNQSISGVGGVRLCVDIAGPADGAPVVLLHGGGQTRHAWRHSQRALADSGYCVAAYDARGHGESDWATDGDYSTDALVGDLRAVIDTLHAPPALVGASMGGITALAAVGESDAVLASALVLVDITPTIEPAGLARIRDFMTGHPHGFASLEEVADAVAAYNPERPRPKDPSGLMKNLRRGDDDRLYWHWDPKIVSDRFDEHTAYLETYESRMCAAAERVHVPTLLVRGASSDVVSPQGIARLRALIPDARIEEIGGAGHMVAGDRNDAFGDAVGAFLAEVLPAVD